MVNGIEVTGWEEMVRYIESLEISDQLETKALNKAGSWLNMKVKDYIRENVELTGFTRKNTTGKIKRVDGNKVYSVALEGWDAHFIEFGSSKNKNHVGFFERNVEENLDTVEEKILDVILEVFN